MKLRKALKDPIKVCVEPGDLIMICAQRPHCAIGFEKGVRVSLQTFVQYKHNQRLFIEG